jgi:putative transposase
MENQANLDQTSHSADDSSVYRFYRRRLPHWQPAGGTIFLTWRLYGSLPEEALERLAGEQRLLQNRPERPGELPRDRALRHNKRLFALVDQMLVVADTGPHWLQDERIAQLAVDALFHHHLKLYVLLAFVVMPNHMHVLLQPLPIEERQARKPAPLEDRRAGKPAPQYVALRKITQSLKGYTAREANRILKRTGLPFWQDESYDHWARDEAEMQRIVDYIESDPVRAALVNHSQDWRCSSAWERELGRMVTTSA